MTLLYLCGAGNPEGVRLALRINRGRGDWSQIQLLDDYPGRWGKEILGVQVAGPFNLLEAVPPEGARVANLVARTTSRRWIARQRIAAYGVPFAPLVDPDVDIDGTVLPDDLIVYRGAVVGAECTLGAGSVVFMGAVVGHASTLGKVCVVAPGAVINARVRLDDGAYVGTNAAILPDVSVGAWVTVGACSLVTHDVPAGATVMGVPGKVMMTRGSDPLPRELRPAASPIEAVPEPAA